MLQDAKENIPILHFIVYDPQGQAFQLLTPKFRTQVELSIVGLESCYDGNLICSHASHLAGASLHVINATD